MRWCHETLVTHVIQEAGCLVLAAIGLMALTHGPIVIVQVHLAMFNFTILH